MNPVQKTVKRDSPSGLSFLFCASGGYICILTGQSGYFGIFSIRYIDDKTKNIHDIEISGRKRDTKPVQEDKSAYIRSQRDIFAYLQMKRG